MSRYVVIIRPVVFTSNCTQKSGSMRKFCVEFGYERFIIGQKKKGLLLYPGGRIGGEKEPHWGELFQFCNTHAFIRTTCAGGGTLNFELDQNPRHFYHGACLLKNLDVRVVVCCFFVVSFNPTRLD